MRIPFAGLWCVACAVVIGCAEQAAHDDRQPESSAATAPAAEVEAPAPAPQPGHKLTPEERREALIGARQEDGIRAQGVATGLVAFGDAVYFSAPAREGPALWRSDGTREGTRPVITGGRIRDLASTGGALSFTTRGGAFTKGAGRFPVVAGSAVVEFWLSDGTAEGTRKLLYGTVETYHSRVRQGIRVPDPGHVSFQALSAEKNHFICKLQVGLGGSPRRYELYVWREGTDDPELLTAVSGRDSLVLTGTHRDHVLFTVCAQLWTSDGTKAGTRQLHRGIVDQGWGLHDNEKLRIGDTEYLRRRTDELGDELWKLPAAGAEAVLVKDIMPGRKGSNPRCFAEVAGDLVFLVDSNQLWASDGTPGGTRMISPNAGSPPYVVWTPPEIDGVRLTYYHRREYGRELHRWSGDGDRPVLIKDIHPGRGGSSTSALVDIGDLVVFAADDGVHGTELWRTDGTTEGTHLLKDINPGADPSQVTYLTSAGNVACFFAAADGNDYSLWRTDGTVKGTRQVVDVLAGSSGMTMSKFVAVGTTLFFTTLTHREIAPDPGSSHPHGAVVYCSELWKTDGSDERTEVLQRWFKTVVKSPPPPPEPPEGRLERMMRRRIHNIPQVPSAPRPDVP